MICKPMLVINKLSQIKNLFILIAILASLLVLINQNSNEVLREELREITVKIETPNSLVEDKKDGNSLECKIPTLNDVDEFLNIWKTNGKASCANLGEFGGNNRADKTIFPYNEASRMVCLDDIKRGNCTVLSFGVGMDSSFDKEMADISRCQVYMFDPTLNRQDSKFKSNKQFFNLGLYDKSGTISIKNKMCKVDRYEGILQMLNLTDQVVDYLKIDIEVAELNFFKDVLSTSPHLLNNVKQLAMEIHPILYKNGKKKMTLRKSFKPFWQAMHQLECLGFELISFIPNWFPVCKLRYRSRVVSGCYDVVFINKGKNKQA